MSNIVRIIRILALLSGILLIVKAVQAFTNYEYGTVLLYLVIATAIFRLAVYTEKKKPSFRKKVRNYWNIALIMIIGGWIIGVVFLITYIILSGK